MTEPESSDHGLLPGGRSPAPADSRFRPLSERELLERVRGGEVGAFGELWRRNASASLRSANYLAGDLDPEDVLAESYLRVFKILQDGRGPTSGFRTYVQVTMKNVAAAIRRAGGEHVNLDELYEGIPELTESGFEQRSADGALVRQALAALPEDWQEVLWCTEVLGMKPREIASRLRLTPNAAAALAYRARARLKETWLELHVAYASRPAECQAVIRVFSQLAEGSATPDTRDSAEEHLAWCESCQSAFEEIQRVGSRSLKLATLSAVLLAAGGLSALGSFPAPEAAAAAAQNGAGVGLGADRLARIALLTGASLVVGMGAMVWFGASPVSERARVEPGTSGTAPEQSEQSEPGGEAPKAALEGAVFRLGREEVLVEGTFVRSVVIDLRGVAGADYADALTTLDVAVTPPSGTRVSALVENPNEPGLFTAGLLSSSPGTRTVAVSWGEWSILAEDGETSIDVAFGSG